MLSHRLRTLRRSRRLSQIALAQMAGLSQSYLSRLEMGVLENPSSDVVRRLAGALDVHVALLYGLPDEGPEPGQPGGIRVTGEVAILSDGPGEVRGANSESLRLPDSMTALRVSEDGLIPGAGPGAHLLVVAGEVPADGDLAVVRRGDGRWLRLVFWKPGNRMLLLPAGTDSDAGLPAGTYPQEEIMVEGRVRGVLYPGKD